MENIYSGIVGLDALYNNRIVTQSAKHERLAMIYPTKGLNIWGPPLLQSVHVGETSTGTLTYGIGAGSYGPTQPVTSPVQIDYSAFRVIAAGFGWYDTSYKNVNANGFTFRTNLRDGVQSCRVGEWVESGGASIMLSDAYASPDSVIDISAMYAGLGDVSGYLTLVLELRR